ncbi:alpha/beta fold hydrolase [Paracoccus sulfuroxidans]|uniref:Pimeloyl-ACP methyl ester carboxylesterase n=1 Tax=Paracoccus sulfuroxidans TaxID=384678 RepID=A0A562NHE9_9RHOB|nr:alpha/beta fold hydrolase [Paracoccus sulfuroxidans]TWI31523.1 pimeloyl-ACP methyl ester carboxylesterase [Paracoccus sulfuroxidans]
MHVSHWPGTQDRPALALHCMMGSSSYWRPIASALKDQVAFIAPDFPGHGQSPDWEGAPPDLHTAATRQVATLIDRPMDLIGHSFGATVALRIAVAAPEAVRSLTLIEPVLFAAAGPDRVHSREMKMVDELLAEGRDAEAARSFLTAWGGADWDGHSPASQARLARQIRLVAETGDALDKDSANILREGGLEAIDAPVLLVMGEKSPPIIERIVDALAHRLPDVGRARLPNAGHMLPITHPRQTAELIALNLEQA